MNQKYYQQAIDFLNREDFFSLSPGKYVIDEGNVWVNIIDANLRPVESALLEAHDEFMDIQVPFDAAESFGIKPRTVCSKPRGTIDRENDIIFFDDKIEEVKTLGPRETIIFKPDTAHAPLIGSGTVRKAIFKVRYTE